MTIKHVKHLKAAILCSAVIICTACRESTRASSTPLELTAEQREELNQVIDSYNDRTLSKIIELRDYSFRKANIFCAHAIVQMSQQGSQNGRIDVIAKLQCAEPYLERDEARPGGPGKAPGMINQSILPVKYFVYRTQGDKFSVQSFQLPRPQPYYLDDTSLYFTQNEFRNFHESVVDSGALKKTIHDKVRADLAKEDGS